MQNFSHKRKMIVLLTCCMSVLLVSIDMTALNVAIPTIGRDLGASPHHLAWVIDAYSLCLAALLVLSASLADRFGRKRLFIIGLSVFMIGSLCCAMASSLSFLILARVIQAVGGSMMNPVAMAILTSEFTERSEKARAIGIWSGATGVAMAIGPVIGGLLVDAGAGGWRYVFLINIPLGLLTIISTLVFIKESINQKRPIGGIDGWGQLFIALFLGLLTFGILEGGNFGWLSLATISIFAGAAVSLIALIARETHARLPLLRLSFFKSPSFTGAIIIAVVSFAAFASFLLLNSLYLQQIRGLSASAAGLAILPVAIMAVVFGPINGRILAKFGSRLSYVIGGSGVLIAAMLLLFIGPNTPYFFLVICYMLMGLGNIAVGAPISLNAVLGMPPEHASVAASMSTASRQIGQTLGVAVAGALLGTLSLTDTGKLFDAIHASWWPLVFEGVIIIVVGLWVTKRRFTTLSQPQDSHSLS